MAKTISWITLSAPTRLASGALYSPMASTRYRVLIPAQALQGYGHVCHILGKDEAFERAEVCLRSQIIIFSKSYREENIAMALVAKKQGIRIVLDLCDNHYADPAQGKTYAALTQLADLVTCNTPQMAECAAQFGAKRTLVIPDPYESAAHEPRFAPAERLVLGWFGFPSSLDGLIEQMDTLTQLSLEMPLTLKFTTSAIPAVYQLVQDLQRKLPPSLQLIFLPWSPQAQEQVMNEADILLLPSPLNEKKLVKSANRMIEALRHGKPVVASPLPCYLPFNAWVAVGEDLAHGIRETLRQREAIPTRIAEAQEYIQTHFSPVLVGDLWNQALESLA